MQLICPECKNTVDLSPYPQLVAREVLECEHCGITLEIKNLDGETISAEVVDEGK